MNLNYDVKTWDISLKTRCAVKVAYHSLLVSGFKPEAANNYALVKMANERVKHLDLPHHLKDSLMYLIPRIYNELKDWYSCFNCVDTLPVLTAQGTIDQWQSSKTIVHDEKVNTKTRFIMACMFCHEESIFTLGRMMSSDELENVRSRESYSMEVLSQCLVYKITNLWLNVMLDIDSGLRAGPWLSTRECNKGFIFAGYGGNSIALKFYISKGTTDLARMPDNLLLNTIKNFHRLCPYISPDTYCLLYSLLSEEQQLSSLGWFSHHILKSLLRWPYERFFVAAAHSLVMHLPIKAYWDIHHDIVLKIVCNTKMPHDYLEIYIKFWDIGANLLGDMRFSKKSCFNAYHYICLLGNKVLINHFLAEIPHDMREMCIKMT